MIRVDGIPRDPGPVSPGTPLIRVLVKKLEIDGIHKRCRSSSCGGCMVLLDGEPVKACAISWAEAEGRDVQTLGEDADHKAG